MSDLQWIITGFGVSLEWGNLLYCLIGVSVGMVLGIMPGIGPAAGTAMLIPLTFSMNSTSAVIMLAGIFYGAMYGGTITSVLLNVPGEAASVITCLDGYQMARQGRAGTALGIAAIGSFIGGTVAVIGLSFVAPMIAKFALRFGPPEFFSLMVMGLILLTGLTGGSLLKGLIATTAGLLLSLVGIDPISGATRFTGGLMSLLNGLDFVIIAMGLFGIGEILLNVEKTGGVSTPAEIHGLLPKRAEWRPAMGAIGRGTIIGFFIGLIPGANAAIATFVSYTAEKKVSRYPQRFGTGAIEGVAGPEAANNAYSGASLIPLLTLGLPTSPTVAVLMGAFIMHGIMPGPMLFEENPNFVWAVITSMYIGNVILVIMNLPLAKLWSRLVYIPYNLTFPVILLITMVGAFSLNNSLADVVILLIAGIAGYFLKKLEFPIAGMVLALVLGNQIERTFLQSLAMSKGDISILFNRPISVVFLGIAAIILAFNIMGEFKQKKMIFEESEL